MPLRPLLLLISAVLGAHCWILAASSVPVRVREPVTVTTFITRSVAASMRAGADRETAAEPTSRPQRAPARMLVRRTVARPPTRAVTSSEAPSAPSPEPAVVTVAAVAAEPVVAVAPSAQATPRFSVPAAAHLHYQVTAAARHMRVQGEGDLIWRHDGNSYEARLELSAPFLPRRIQHSAGLITAEGLAPLRFSDKSRSEEAAHFVRDQGKVTFSSNRPDAPLLAGTQDRLSVMLQLGAMIGGAPARFPPGTLISVPTASTREAEPWLFTVEGHEALELPGGTVDAVKLIRNPRREFDQKVELWLAPAMDYVPVRLRLTQANGDWVDQQWSSTDRR